MNTDKHGLIFALLTVGALAWACPSRSAAEVPAQIPTLPSRGVPTRQPIEFVLLSQDGKPATQPNGGLRHNRRAVTPTTALANFANMPLHFEAGRGRAGAPGEFLARAGHYQLRITPTEAQLVLSKAERLQPESPFERHPPIRPREVWMRGVGMEFVNANPKAHAMGEEELAGKVNYIIGNDPAQWRLGVPTFSKVQVESLYPGIDLVYYGNQRQLEYDFKVAPGADPNAIAIHFSGADKVAVNQQGELVLTLGPEEIHQPLPAVYQTIGAERRPVSGSYRLCDPQTVAFVVNQYDRGLPLTIDPVLLFSTYFGGNADDQAWAVKFDTNDNTIYLAGQTLSTEFPILTNFFGFQNTNGSMGIQSTNGRALIKGDAFVAKLDANGNVLYFTFLGGRGNDSALDIAVDSAGEAFVTGFTDSTNFPMTNAYQQFLSSDGTNAPPNRYFADAFITELSTNGFLEYSTYFGGNLRDVGIGIGLDASNNVYVTGYAYSTTNFPIINPLTIMRGFTSVTLSNVQGSNDVFVAKINPRASGNAQLLFSTFLGGTNFDVGQGIAVDASNYVYVTGYTSSTNFPVTTNIFPGLDVARGINHTTNAPHFFSQRHVPRDAFVSKIGTNTDRTTTLLYSLFIGDTNDDSGFRIRVDSGGTAYITGSSDSPFFDDDPSLPRTAPKPDVININLPPGVTNQGSLNTDAFVAKIQTDENGSVTNVLKLLFGGISTDEGWDLAIGPLSANIFIVGTTTTTNFPIFPTTNPPPPFLMQTNQSRGSDVFVVALSNDLSVLDYSVLLGGTRDDYGYGIDVDTSNTAYIVGQTLSADFPTLNAEQPVLLANSDAFLAKIQFSPPVTLTVATVVTNLVAFSVDTNFDATNVVTESIDFPGTPHFFSTSPVQTNGSNSDIRYVWNNWTTINGPVSQVISNFVFPLSDTTIIANFTTQYLVINGVGLINTNNNQTNFGIGGAVFPASGWVNAGSNVTLFASSASNATFTGWIGTITDSSNPLVITNVTSSINETAVFSGEPTDLLTILTNGSGTVSPDLNGTAVKVGTHLTITAHPAPGYQFAGWTGGAEANSATLTFKMTNSLVLQANFVPNPFSPVEGVSPAGNYSGLFFNPTNVTFTNSGSFSASVTENGSLSGQLHLAGRGYSFSGQFTNQANPLITDQPNQLVFSTFISRKNLHISPLFISLQLVNNSMMMTGLVSDEVFQVPLQANHAAVPTATPVPQTGRYTFIIPGAANPQEALEQPGGDGFGTASVDAAGNVTFSGTLADGTVVTEGTTLSAQGSWPLYLSLYSSRGSIIGWIENSAVGQTNISGTIGWFKPFRHGAGRYSGGFAVTPDMNGSIYTNSHPALTNFSPGLFVLDNADVTNALSIRISIGTNNRVTILDKNINDLSLSISTGSGLFSGSVINPATRRTESFKGAILQNQNFGAGFFLGTNQVGRVQLLP